MTNLGLVLAERYERRRAGNDLDGAVSAFRRAVELTPDRVVVRPWMLLNLGDGLIDIYERQHRGADLDDAVGRLAEGLALLSPGSADTAAFHNRLSVGSGTTPSATDQRIWTAPWTPHGERSR